MTHKSNINCAIHSDRKMIEDNPERAWFEMLVKNLRIFNYYDKNWLVLNLNTKYAIKYLIIENIVDLRSPWFARTLNVALYVLQMYG